MYDPNFTGISNMLRNIQNDSVDDNGRSSNAVKVRIYISNNNNFVWLLHGERKCVWRKQIHTKLDAFYGALELVKKCVCPTRKEAI